MVPMATGKKKNNPPVNPATAAGRKGHQLPTRVSDGLWELLKAEAKGERRTVAQMVRILLEEALRGRGRDVPDEEQP